MYKQKGRPYSLIGIDITTHKKDFIRNKEMEKFKKKRKYNQYEF